MKRCVIIMALMPLFLISCENKVETLKLEIDQSFNSSVINPLINLAENIEMYYELEPSNFWYEEGTTVLEAMKDNYKLPLKKLKKLQSTIKKINPSDDNINSSISLLNNEIEVQLNKIIKAQDGLGAINQVVQYHGGIDQYFRLMRMMGANTRILYEEISMEEPLMQKIIELRDKLDKYNDELVDSIGSYQRVVYKRDDLSDIERKEIIDYSNKKILDSFKSHYTGSDTVLRNQVIQNFMVN